MPYRGLQVVPTEDDAGVGEEHLALIRLRPYVCLLQNRLRIVDGSSGSSHFIDHPKSPSAAWPSTSRTSTGAPTCSLIFTASADRSEERRVGKEGRSWGA